MATIARLACTWSPSVWTVTPPGPWTIRSTGERSTTRWPSLRAIFSASTWEPPTKRHIWAPSRVLKLRSKVPGFCSSPDAAM